MGEEYVIKGNFIESLKLPNGVEARRFNGMSRVHFKYNEKGFAVIDMKASTYNFASRPEHFKAIGITKHDVTYNLGPNRAIIWNIPYSDTTYLYKLIDYIVGKEPAEKYLKVTKDARNVRINTAKSMDINAPMAPQSKLIKSDGIVQLICGNCGEIFIQAPRCPECGQLVLIDSHAETDKR